MFRRLIVLILFSLLSAPFSASLAEEAQVFVYHRFGDGRYPSTNIDLDTFAAQLEVLRREKATVLPLGEIVRRLRNGTPLPERCAALTVDDAYDTFLTGAMPLLRRYGFSATLFVSTDKVGNPGYLGWDELRSLAEAGIEIGNHTASHDSLLDRRRGEGDEAWRERVGHDIRKAQEDLAGALDSEPILFAYPYGEYDPEIVAIVKDLGFEGAVAQQSGVIHSDSDPFTLPRFPMGGPYATVDGFREKLAMKALRVQVLAPSTPVVGEENPPTLAVRIDGTGVDLSRLRCFVPGQPEATIIPDPDDPGRYRVRARHPLEGRRSKYTLTAPAVTGSGWYWFSQLWVNPEP